MAWLFKRDRSPFYWIAWRNPETDKVERFSSEFRIDDPAGRGLATELKNKFAVKEGTPNSPLNKHPFATWVPEFLKATHSPQSAQRYLGIWRSLAGFLEEQNVIAPAQVRRQHALDYFEYRCKTSHMGRHRKKLVSRNTALLELKTFSKVMNESVARGYIPANTISRLKLKKDPPRVKGELTDRHVAIIQRKIAALLKHANTDEEKTNATFLSRSFEIARLQGIRLAETHLPIEAADLTHGTLEVVGKGRKVEVVPLNPALFPLFRKLREEGATHTYARGPRYRFIWWEFFAGLRKRFPEFNNISFHSTRVTVISRMERAGVPENVMMKAVLHSSATVHRIYRRVKPSELAPYWGSVGKAS